MKFLREVVGIVIEIKLPPQYCKHGEEKKRFSVFKVATYFQPKEKPAIAGVKLHPLKGKVFCSQ
jgi:hypothetical protein